MDFSDYQKLAWETAIYPDKGRNLYYPALGLGEAGEVQGKVKKVMRDHGGEVTRQMRIDIIAELGDVLWYVAAMATELGVDMSDIAEYNIAKLNARKNTGNLQGSGDHRGETSPETTTVDAKSYYSGGVTATYDVTDEG